METMNVFETYKVENDGIWLPKEELERLRTYWRKKTYRQAKLQMLDDLSKTEGKISLIENLIGLIEDN